MYVNTQHTSKTTFLRLVLKQQLLDDASLDCWQVADPFILYTYFYSNPFEIFTINPIRHTSNMYGTWLQF